jgi:hypothetical protein
MYNILYYNILLSLLVYVYGSGLWLWTRDKGTRSVCMYVYGVWLVVLLYILYSYSIAFITTIIL